MKKGLLLFALTVSASMTFAQRAKEFWFAPPEVSATLTTFDGLEADRPVKLHLISGPNAATVTISQPANSSGMPTQTISLAANSTVAVDLTTWIDALETKPSNNVLNTGLKISSTDTISAYYGCEHTANAEYFMLKGHNALGVDFWIVSPDATTVGTHFPPSGYLSFDIVATEDNTAVTITPSKNIVGHAANTPFTVTLNSGQTWSAQSLGYGQAAHLGGSHITSTAPIAVTLKDDMLNAPATGVGAGYDLAGDQALPTQMLGKKYIAVRGSLNNNKDYVFITATEDSTQILVSGFVQYTLNRGNVYTMDISNVPVAFIETSKPVAVYHLTGKNAELGGKQLSSIDNSGSYAATYTRLLDHDLFITLVVSTPGLSTFMVNGLSSVIPASAFAQVPGTTDKWFAKVDLSNITAYPAGGDIKVTNSASRFQMGVVDAWPGWGAAVAYFSDFYTEPVLGVNELSIKNNIWLYPNPTKGILFVSGEKITGLNVINSIGQKLNARITYGNNTNAIDIVEFAAGTYFVEITTLQGKVTHKVILTK
jgi:hypothetical protein